MSIDINLSLVAKLIKQQFTQWSHLSISSVTQNGIDNKTFRLGNELLIRLPSAQGYAAQVEKEQRWLPILASRLSTTIPTPVAQGSPSRDYPWNWSVYRWIHGESANLVELNSFDQHCIAKQLANFLKELHQINTQDAPAAGLHNYYRGAHPSVYDKETRLSIHRLSDSTKADRATAIWEKALNSQWDKDPVWVHGDFASGNILLESTSLTAVIDFGCMGIGDPACDLTIAWTFLNKEIRKIFKSCLDLDEKTWERARGWALWKALQKTGPEAEQREKIISTLINEDENYAK